MGTKENFASEPRESCTDEILPEEPMGPLPLPRKLRVCGSKFIFQADQGSVHGCRPEVWDPEDP